MKKNRLNPFTSFKLFNLPDLVRGPFEWLKKQGGILFQSSRSTPLLACMFEVKKRRDLWVLDYAVISNHIHLCSKTPAERDCAEYEAYRRPQIIKIRTASVEGDQMAKKEIIQVNFAAGNPNLSPATRFGNLVFVAGQTGRHPITGEVGKDVGEQTRYAIERIKMILATAGTSLDNVLTVLTHLTKREDLAAYNEEYGKFFPNNKPARTTVEAMLNFPELLVEITVTACIPE